MLTRRVMVGLMFDDGVLTRTKNFRADYRYTTSFLAVDAIDEAVLIDITRSGPSEASRAVMLEFANRCYAPVTMGGWIRSTDDVARFFDIGADKVVIGRGAHEKGLIEAIAVRWGSQAVTVACDVKGAFVAGPMAGGSFESSRGVRPEDWCREVQTRGVGEIFLQDIERDGSLSGYALPLLRRVVEAVSIPVTVGTGCGSWQHMQAAFEAGADGAVTTCVHHWTESALRGFKDRLAERGVAVRRAA